ncbi:hypothetical protein N7468_008790 [Penicillium chermesinum]|uniref:Uncharacterized protein n=1 Tax=Penicillium chermesinum TaxID=63820 RepID=A0A9W9NGM4_9EURO|nr:uncharacterized protein N7468_008790 [Penicillium chermesinum]KAJ5219586.1 hypothetical protein N7468_008790 [Penicillium chermesinum]
MQHGGVFVRAIMPASYREARILVHRALRTRPESSTAAYRYDTAELRERRLLSGVRWNGWWRLEKADDKALAWDPGEYTEAFRQWLVAEQYMRQKNLTRNDHQQ